MLLVLKRKDSDIREIATAKPGLQAKITNRLLKIEQTHHKPDRKELFKSGIIKSSDESFKDIRQKKES